MVPARCWPSAANAYVRLLAYIVALPATSLAPRRVGPTETGASGTSQTTKPSTELSFWIFTVVHSGRPRTLPGGIRPPWSPRQARPSAVTAAMRATVPARSTDEVAIGMPNVSGSTRRRTAAMVP